MANNAPAVDLILMLGKFGWESTLWIYPGMGGLICASLWSGRHRKNASNTTCPSCKPQNAEK